jgi:hypothetical protein
MKNQTVKTLLCLTAGVMTALILAGCPSTDLSGVHKGNLSPWVDWAQVRQDSLAHSSNPVLKWFGSDRDGQVVDYQYVVSLKDTVDAYGGAATMAANFPQTIEWTSLGEVTSSTIPLFASEDTSEYVEQYVFLKCLDDSGAYSAIIYLFLSRNNHPPTCTVTVPTVPRWCLPDTNQFWHGITVSWEGKDSIDYPGIQPDFIWNARLYGPFATTPVSTDTLPQYLYSVALDPETGADTVTFTQAALLDLQTGWYILYVKNFDDAHVAAIPALGIFEVYEPNWIRHPTETKDILIINQSTYAPVPGNLGPAWQDSVRIFYENILADAGFSSDQWDWTAQLNPPLSMLYNYRMVIIDDIDWNLNIGSSEDELQPYIEVGGKLWVIGRFSFANVSNQTGRLDYGPTNHPIAYTCMGISAAYFPPGVLDFAEFEGARPVAQGLNLPDLHVDTLYIQALAGSFDYALPRVEYLLRRDEAQTLYVFNSIDPSQPGSFEGFPVAIRYDTGTFKTSYFSFPLFFIRYEQATQIASHMLTWFLEDSQ